jgi:hypothetical protein
MSAPRLASLLAVGLVTLATGCASERALFRPREKVQAESPDGYPAALYVLDRDGRNVGELRIWSAGAWRAETHDERTVIHVGLEVENRSGGPLTVDLDATELRDVQGESPVATLQRLDARGEPVVPDRGIGRIDLLFGLPDKDPGPRTVQGFHARWLLRGADQRDYEELTPFGRDWNRYGHDAWRGGYGLYWGGPWHYRWSYWGPSWCW